MAVEIQIPHELSSCRFSDLVQIMTDINPDFVLPQTLLKPATFLISDFSRTVDYSLAAQLPALLASSPEVVLFTANSAIPVADAFRGIYDTLGQETPLLTWIDTKARYRYESPAEITRLKRILDGRTQATIVDEYVDWGTTLERARHLLKAAGVTSTQAIMGHWYHNADRKKSDTSFSTMSSRFAKSMHKIGERAVITSNTLVSS